MSESGNGQSLSQRDRPKPKQHNAKRCALVTRQRIVTALAQGDSQRSIARALRVSPSTVSAVAAQEWEQVETRKQRLAAQAERNALLAGEQIAEALHQRKYPPSALVPVYGVSLDKALALRGDVGLTIRHDHTHRIADDDILAYALARSEKQAKAAVVEVPALPAETGLQAKKTPRKRGVKPTIDKSIDE
jgi:hypothetical protein